MQKKKPHKPMLLQVLKVLRQYLPALILSLSFLIGAVVFVSQADLVNQIDRYQTFNHNEVGVNTIAEAAQPQEAAEIPDEEPLYDVSARFKGDRFTVLLAGLDRRPEEVSLSNTDTLLVASVNLLSGGVALLSIPRDTKVMVPDHGLEKINVAARVGKGIRTTVSLTEELIGQPINGYVLTDFNGFKSIIDTLGGITLDVEKDMYYVSAEDADGVIDLKKGLQRLYGDQTLQYARFRQDPLADISRAARQQAVVKAIGKEFLQVKTLPKLPWLIPQVMKAVDTDLPLTQILSLANRLTRMENPQITSQTLPGNFLIENDVSYWQVDLEKAHKAVERLFEEGETSATFAN